MFHQKGLVTWVIASEPVAEIQKLFRQKGYDVPVLHDPNALWNCVRSYAKKRTLVFVTDLFRPTSRARAQALVRKYSAGEAPVLKRDFYNSLLAAFTPDEVAEQLAEAKLGQLRVNVISDRHLMIYGRIR